MCWSLGFLEVFWELFVKARECGGLSSCGRWKWWTNLGTWISDQCMEGNQESETCGHRVPREFLYGLSCSQPRYPEWGQLQVSFAILCKCWHTLANSPSRDWCLFPYIWAFLTWCLSWIVICCSFLGSFCRQFHIHSGFVEEWGESWRIILCQESNLEWHCNAKSSCWVARLESLVCVLDVEECSSAARVRMGGHSWLKMYINNHT